MLFVLGLLKSFGWGKRPIFQTSFLHKKEGNAWESRETIYKVVRAKFLPNKSILSVTFLRGYFRLHLLINFTLREEGTAICNANFNELRAQTDIV